MNISDNCLKFLFRFNSISKNRIVALLINLRNIKTIGHRKLRANHYENIFKK